MPTPIMLCRFFVVEDHILHATQGLVTRAFTDELWNMALSKIIAVLRTHSVSPTHTHTHLDYCHSNKIAGVGSNTSKSFVNLKIKFFYKLNL